MALLTAGDIIGRARYILNDNPADSADRRWTDTEMLYWVVEGYRIMMEFRPDFYIETEGSEYTTVPIPDGGSVITTTASDIRCHLQKAPALIDFVLSRAFAKDGETGDNDLSEHYLKLFYEKLK